MRKIKILLASLFAVVLIFVLVFSCKHKSLEAALKNKAVGVDVSNCQGEIDWQKFANQKNYKLKFVIIRATMGDDRKDDKFFYNFPEAKKQKLLVGSYHYYDPNEPSNLQAENYLKNSNQAQCDILPVLDIENLSKIQSTEKLLSGVKNWLSIVEKKTGYKPIIYTGLAFYKAHLANKKEFADYPRWIAAYSDRHLKDACVQNAHIHQFSEKIWIKGLKKKVKVDVNVVPDSEALKKILKNSSQKTGTL